MTTKMEPGRELLEFLSVGHQKILEKVNRLEEVLTHLQYEGKASRGKNLKEIKGLMDFFNTVYRDHMAIEEDLIYPFFKMHVPKFEAVIDYLYSEHHEIQRRLRMINSQYKKMKAPQSNSNYAECVDEMNSIGTYFYCLVQNHIRTESENIFKMILSELRRDELEELGWAIARQGESDGDHHQTESR